MKYLVIFFFSITQILVIGNYAVAQKSLTKRQERNLTAFAKIYGYMQYFHPSDEAQQINWAAMRIKGSKQMLSLKNDEQLIKELNNLFKPIGPSIKIFPTNHSIKFDIKELYPPIDTQNIKIISWQHRGLYIYDSKTYANVRLNRPLPEAENDSETINFDVRQFAGLPFEILISVPKADSVNNYIYNLNYSLAAEEGNSNEKKQQYLNLKLLSQKKEYTLQGKINVNAEVLSLNFTFPTNFQGKLSINAIFNRQKIPLTVTSGKTVSSEGIQTGSLNITSPDMPASPLYKEQLRLGDYIQKEVVKGINCIIPLALAGDTRNTYPVADTVKLKELITKLNIWDKYPPEELINFPEIRLANIIKAWNILKHGYPYWENASETPETILSKALNGAYSNSPSSGYHKTLQEMAAALNDGHGFVTCGCGQIDTAGVPVYFGKVENKIVVLRVLDSTLTNQIAPGDIVQKINGLRAKKVLQEKAALISGSPQNKEFRALVQIANGPADKPLQLRIRHQNKTQKIRLARSVKAESVRLGNQITAQLPNGWIAPGVYYYDLTSFKYSFSQADYHFLSQAKSVIFDVRGYPDDKAYNLIPYLLKEPIAAKHFFTPKILKPDQQDLLFEESITRYSPADKHLNGKMYFLIDAVAQSSAESFLALIKDFKLGTLVGRPTSGANGNINTIVLLGNSSISFSGLVVKNHDGSKHHTVGILPDVLVTPTLKDIKNRKDAILEAALILAVNNK